MIVSKILKTKAHPKLSTLKVGTIHDAISMKTAFRTSKNKPIVKKVMGKVISTMIGYTSTFSIAITMATNVAVQKAQPLMRTPGRIPPIMMIETTVIKNRRIG